MWEYVLCRLVTGAVVSSCVNLINKIVIKNCCLSLHCDIIKPLILHIAVYCMHSTLYHNYHYNIIVRIIIKQTTAWRTLSDKCDGGMLQ